MRSVRLSVLWYSVARHKQQETSQQQVKSARASPLAFSSIASQLFLFAKDGEKCEMRAFRRYGIWSRVASSRRPVNSKSSLPELALLLSARSPVSPAAFLASEKWRKMRSARFSLLWHSDVYTFFSFFFWVFNPHC